MNKMTHTGSDGSSVGTRITREGYDWSTVGENVAQGHSSNSAVVKGWMNSAGHRKNILNPLYKEMGFGVTNRFYTQTFGTCNTCW